MDTDHSLRNYLEQQTNVIPDFYTDTIPASLGAFAGFLPAGGMAHDQNAYLKKTERAQSNGAQALLLA